MKKNYTRDEVIKLSEFYTSVDWILLCFHAIELQGRVCQLCGRALGEFDEHAEKPTCIHVDHIVPLSIDWSKRFDINNLQVLCTDCYVGKMLQEDTTDWR